MLTMNAAIIGKDIDNFRHILLHILSYRHLIFMGEVTIRCYCEGL